MVTSQIAQCLMGTREQEANNEPNKMLSLSLCLSLLLFHWSANGLVESPTGQHNYRVDSQNVELCNGAAKINLEGIGVSNVRVEVPQSLG